MKVVICWAGISGYLAACWRALAAQGGVDLHVITYPPRPDSPVRFQKDLLAGVDCTWIQKHDLGNQQQIMDLVAGQKPDVVVLPGWMFPVFRQMPNHPKFAAVRFVMGMDTPWRGDWRQQVGRFALRRMAGRIDRVAVAGERAAQYALRLGFDESQIWRGVYGFDDRAFGSVFKSRGAQDDPCPRRFVFVGRYVPDKGIDVLLEAYQRYRDQTSDPWPLTCCGSGPLRDRIRQSEGVVDRGFVQPHDLPELLQEHGVFLLPSRYEPWGVVIAEAMGSGMPVICTEACGASVEMVRSLYNGMVIPTGNVAALVDSMRYVHEHADVLPTWGQRGQQFAAAYSASQWAHRWSHMLRKLTTSN